MRWVTRIADQGMEIIGGRLMPALVTEFSQNDNEADVRWLSKEGNERRASDCQGD
jgi:hypothetical protein